MLSAQEFFRLLKMKASPKGSICGAVHQPFRRNFDSFHSLISLALFTRLLVPGYNSMITYLANFSETPVTFLNVSSSK